MNNESPNIYQRILAVMDELSYVQKEDKMVNNQYTFVSHDAVTATIHPLLVRHGIVMLPSVVKWDQDGNRTSCEMLIAFINADNPEESLTVTSFGYGIDQQDKGPGKAMSYAVKYAILKTFALETGDDPERDNIDYKKSSVDMALIAESAKAIIEAIDADDKHAVSELYGELTPEEKEAIWVAKTKNGWFTQDQKTFIRASGKPSESA